MYNMDHFLEDYEYLSFNATKRLEIKHTNMFNIARNVGVRKLNAKSLDAASSATYTWHLDKPMVCRHADLLNFVYPVISHGHFHRDKDKNLAPYRRFNIVINRLVGYARSDKNYGQKMITLLYAARDYNNADNAWDRFVIAKSYAYSGGPYDLNAEQRDFDKYLENRKAFNMIPKSLRIPKAWVDAVWAITTAKQNLWNEQIQGKVTELPEIVKPYKFRNITDRNLKYFHAGLASVIFNQGNSMFSRFNHSSFNELRKTILEKFQAVNDKNIVNSWARIMGRRVSTGLAAAIITYIEDGHRLAQVNNVPFIKNTDSIAEMLTQSVNIHRIDNERLAKIEASHYNDSTPREIPQYLTDNLKKYSFKTVGDVRKAGKECEHCIGSYATSDYLLFKDKSVCAMADPATFAIIQCFDKQNKISKASKTFEKFLKKEFAKIEKPTLTRTDMNAAAFNYPY